MGPIQDLCARASVTQPGKSPAQGSRCSLGKARGTGATRGPNAHKPTREVRVGAEGAPSGRLLRKGQERGDGCAGRWGRDGSSAGRRVTGAGGRGARAPDRRGQGGAGRRAQLANSPPLSLPQERGTGTRCAASENSWGTSPAHPHPLPSFPARRPARSGPYLPAQRLPGRPAHCGRLGGRAGGRQATRPRTWRTRLGRRSRPGGQGRKKRQLRAPGRRSRGRRSGRSQRPRRAAPRGDCAAAPLARAARSLGPRLPPRWGPGAPPRAPLSPLPPPPPLWGRGRR